MEAKSSFADASTSGSKEKMDPEMDPSILTTFLETCMKLLCDSKAMKGLQELITRCARTVPSPEAWEAHDANRKGDEIDYTDRGI